MDNNSPGTSLQSQDHVIQESSTVFLGGTCNGSDWRENLVKLHDLPFLPIDPRVEYWERQHRLNEDELRENADYSIYVITPKMRGIYTFIQITEDACNRPNRTAFCILDEDDGETFLPRLKRNLTVSSQRWEELGATKLENLKDINDWLWNHN